MCSETSFIFIEDMEFFNTFHIFVALPQNPYKEDPEYYKKYQLKYIEKNKDKINKRQREKYKTDPIYRQKILDKQKRHRRKLK